MKWRASHGSKNDITGSKKIEHVERYLRLPECSNKIFIHKVYELIMDDRTVWQRVNSVMSQRSVWTLIGHAWWNGRKFCPKAAFMKSTDLITFNRQKIVFKLVVPFLMPFRKVSQFVQFSFLYEAVAAHSSEDFTNVPPNADCHITTVTASWNTVNHHGYHIYQCVSIFK